MRLRLRFLLGDLTHVDKAQAPPLPQGAVRASTGRGDDLRGGYPGAQWFATGQMDNDCEPMQASAGLVAMSSACSNVAWQPEPSVVLTCCVNRAWPFLSLGLPFFLYD